jgi:plastocyanin
MRRRARLLVPLAAALAVVALPAGAARSEDSPVLDAIVGTNDGFDITLNDPSGRKVSSLPAGTYTIVVHDRSAIHNFHLASNDDPTVDFRTDVPFVGDMTFVATFKAGMRYAYACEPHWQVMNGSFLVDRPGSPPPPPPPPPPPKVGRLTAAVEPNGAVSVSRSHVAPGRYRVTVRDRSSRHEFRLVGHGLSRRTGRGFRGVATWNVRLVRGSYTYRSDLARSKRRLRVG